jgi:hypothetical protein
MKRRFTKLPIASIAVVLGSLLIGLSLSPAGAQSALTNGAVTVRSDGAVYLIVNGMRRWVATVQITDEELNAYPEAEPIYAGLAPFGSASASTGTTSSGTTATKTGTSTTGSGTTVASKTTGSTGSSTSKTGSSTSSSSSSSSSSSNSTQDDGESGLAAKDPNDTSLAETTADLDPNAKADPINGGKDCPSTHQIKGGFDKYYWDTDRSDYATVEPEACFVSGAYARAYGYTEIKKKPGSGSSGSSSSSSSKATPTPTPKKR